MIAGAAIAVGVLVAGAMVAGVGAVAADARERPKTTTERATVTAHAGRARATRSVLGEVVDERSAPVKAAMVHLVFADRMQTTKTDGDGAFGFDDASDPILALSFVADGFLGARIDGAQLTETGDLFWSQKLLRAKAGTGRVAGVVVDDQGAPIRSFHVYSMTDAGAFSPEELTPEKARAMFEERHRSYRAMEVEDEHGAFTFELPIGRRTLLVDADGFRPDQGPHVVDIEDNGIASLRVVLERSNALLGVVTNKVTHAPITNAEIFVQGGGGSHGRTDASGRFALRSLPRARITVLVQAPGYRGLYVGGVHGDRSRDENAVVELTPLDDASGDPYHAPREFIGIGVSIDAHALGLLVTDVIRDGPAAGVVNKGDVIVEVDGLNLSGRSMYENAGAVMGDEGTRAHLTILRDGQRRQIDIERRRMISTPER